LISSAQKKTQALNMADEALSIYDEIEIEDMTFDPNLQIYHYPCPCGDRFEIAIDDLRDGEDIAVCPSCSLMIRVIFEVVCSLPASTRSRIWDADNVPYLQSDLPKDGNQPAPGAVSVQA
jgi:diphthamide biosynthesis protein 3